MINLMVSTSTTANFLRLVTGASLNVLLDTSALAPVSAPLPTDVLQLPHLVVLETHLLLPLSQHLKQGITLYLPQLVQQLLLCACPSTQ
jgi:hypothetical protein